MVKCIYEVINVKVIMEFRKGILFVRLKGCLNKKTVGKLERDVIEKIKIGGIRNVVLNIENVKEIDLKGINSLLYTYEVCKNNKGKLLICGLNDNEVASKIRKNRLLKYLILINNELNAFDLVKI